MKTTTTANVRVFAAEETDPEHDAETVITATAFNADKDGRVEIMIPIDGDRTVYLSIDPLDLHRIVHAACIK